MKKIPITNGDYCLVDDEDFDRLIKFKWHKKLGYCLNPNNKEYGGTVYIHRLIMGLKKGDKKVVDFIDGNGCNCQKINMRICSYSENQRNKIATGASKYLGVSLHTVKRKNKAGKIVEYKYWLSHIKVNGKVKHLGLFKDEKTAALEYNIHALKNHGEFARINNVF